MCVCVCVWLGVCESFDLFPDDSRCEGGKLISCAFHLSVVDNRNNQLLIKSHVITGLCCVGETLCMFNYMFAQCIYGVQSIYKLYGVDCYYATGKCISSGQYCLRLIHIWSSELSAQSILLKDTKRHYPNPAKLCLPICKRYRSVHFLATRLQSSLFPQAARFLTSSSTLHDE